MVEHAESATQPLGPVTLPGPSTGASSVGVSPPRRPSLRDATGLLSGTVLLGLGEKLGERFIPLFLVNLGGGALAVGLHQAATNLVGAAAALPGGYMTDRIGSKRALQWFAALASLGFALLVFASRWPLAIAGALMALSWSAVSLPAALVLITRAIPTRNTAWGVSLHSLVRRVPMAVGPLSSAARHSEAMPWARLSKACFTAATRWRSSASSAKPPPIGAPMPASAQAMLMTP